MMTVSMQARISGIPRRRFSSSTGTERIITARN
jgi:hypothetical protein